MPIIQPNWPAPASIRAGTTTRAKWGAPDLDPQSSRSTALLKNLFSLPNEPVWLQQTHSTVMVPAVSQPQPSVADGSFTNEKLRICAVLTADCLPVLLCDQQGTHVAAIHAGWRGLAGGILEAGIKTLPVAPQHLLAWLGPAIGPERFEVGRDVYEAFTALNPAFSSAFKPHKPDKWYANLYELARLKLAACGVTQVYGGDYCTYTQSDLFYSYRRDGGKTGRMASVIWIEKNPMRIVEKT